MAGQQQPVPRRVPAPRRGHLLLFALAWTAFAVYGSLVPLWFRDVSLADALERFRRLPPVSFGIGARSDMATNVLLFIPLTFGWMGVVTCDRGRAVRWLASLLLIPSAFGFALTIEFAQIWFTGRTTSWNDIVAETIGGTIGVAVWLVAGMGLVRWARTYAGDERPHSTLRWIVEAYLLGFAIFSVIPLDLTMSATELYHKYQRGQIILIPFAYSYREPMRIAYQFFADVATFVPAGVWLMIVRPPLTRSWSPLAVGLIGGAALACLMEMAQLLVLSRYTDSTDIILGGLGAGLGAWAMARSAGASGTAAAARPDAPAFRASMALSILLVAAYSAFLVVGFWYPFEWTSSRSLIRQRADDFFRVPFYAFYMGSAFNALRQFLVRLLLFAVLGALLARPAALPRSTTSRRLLTGAGLLYGAALATAIEAGQIVMPSKVADATEVIVCVAGVGIGTLLMRRFVRQAAQSRAPFRDRVRT